MKADLDDSARFSSCFIGLLGSPVVPGNSGSVPGTPVVEFLKANRGPPKSPYSNYNPLLIVNVGNNQ